MTAPSQDLFWQEVHWPLPLDSALALTFLHRLASDSSRGPVVWETRCVEGVVAHLVGTALHQAKSLANTITSLVPGTVVSASSTSRDPLPRSLRLTIKPRRLMLRTNGPSQTARVLLGALTEARFREEQAVVQVVLRTGIRPHAIERKPTDPTQTLLGAIASGARRASPDLAKQMRDKNAELGFRASVRVSSAAKSETRRVAILRALAAGLRTLQSPGIEVGLSSEPLGRLDSGSESRWASLSLSSSEVLALLDWPLDAEQLPGMSAAHPKLLPLTIKTTDRTRVFATTTAPGKARPLSTGIQDALFHTVITGPTGSGKSTILGRLIIADLEANRGVVVIDPKNDLIHDVLERVPASRRDDIIVLDPTQLAPAGLNPLVVPGSSPELIADGILAIFRDLFPTAFGPRVDDVTHASLLTLAHHPGATLTWLPRLLTDAGFRATLIGGLDDPDGLGSFWAGYNGLSAQQQSQFMAPVLSRLRQFLLRPSLRRVLDQSDPRFTLNEIFTGNRVLLVPLNSGILGNDAAKLLGSLLVGQLWQHTLARAAQPASQRPPVSIYIDEMQEFIRLGGDNLGDALARSRSLGVAWHLAHQYRDQLTPDMRAAIDANARNKIVFGVGIKDAKDFAAMAPELKAEDFLALPQHAIYANLMHDGQQTGWVSGKTLPAAPAFSNADELVAASQQRYGRTAESQTADEQSSPVGPSSHPLDGSIGRRKRTAS